MMVTAGLVQEEAELEAILALQAENLPARLSASEALEQGFVTVEHSLDALRRMHQAMPSVVARQDGRLAGYAMAMARECRQFVPILGPFFDTLERLSWGGRPFSSVRFYVMGQICVAKASRGQGVVEALYAGHRQAYGARFELLVTEISARNPRSLRAHSRVGFQELHRYRDAVDEWVVVGWDWHLS
jgi:predicted GNAT superfamily acetyltransferase